MIVKTVILCSVSICRNYLCLKLQKKDIVTSHFPYLMACAVTFINSLHLAYSDSLFAVAYVQSCLKIPIEA